MRYLLRISSIATAIAFAAGASSAVAEDDTVRLTCQSVGYDAPPEPLGDREGHGLTTSFASCRIEAGPMKGGVLTGMDIWEWDKTNAVALASNGIQRKPGATVVYQNTDEKLSLILTDGKVTGWTVSGKGHVIMATGSAASFAGKTYTFTAKPTGPGQFTVESPWD